MLDGKMVKRESLKTFRAAMDAFVDLIVVNASCEASKLSKDERTAHVARARASAEMRRDAAVSLMADTFQVRD